MKDFTIDKLSWHSKLDSSPNFQTRLRQRFMAVSNFLELHGLLSAPLETAAIERGEDFAITSNSLTAQGLQLMKAAYPKWLKSLDRGVDPADTKMLERELNKLKQKTQS